MKCLHEANEQYSALDASYRFAFHSWASRIEQLQRLSKEPSVSDELQTAESQAAQAETVYRNNRNRLVHFILVASRAGSSSASGGVRRLTPNQRQEIERLAYRFWEEGGRREGTAESDWYRAERLVLGRRKIDPRAEATAA
jgi:hypothetical protein